MPKDSLFGNGAPGLAGRDPDEKMQYLGPRRTIKVGEQYYTERMREPSKDPEALVDVLMHGVGSTDVRGGASGFGKFCATQPNAAPEFPVEASSNFRGQATPRNDEPIAAYSEMSGSEIDDLAEFGPGGQPRIEFEVDEPYGRHEDMREQSVLPSGDLHVDDGSIVDSVPLEQSYSRDESRDFHREKRTGSQGTHEERMMRLDSVLEGMFEDY